MDYEIVFIHGFLGQPSDWHRVIENLDYPRSQLHLVDLNKDFSLSELNFQNWPQAFLAWLKKKKIGRPFYCVGYSMGGRLVLPLLEKCLTAKAVLLSSQFGIAESNFSARSDRRLQNQIWAERFLNEDWSEVTQDWNQQDVFRGSLAEPERLEMDFDRSKLAAQMKGFSLSEQKDFSSLFERPDLKILYLVGKKDAKYVDFARQYNTGNCTSKLINNSGHRLLLDQPQLVAQEIQNFF